MPFLRAGSLSHLPSGGSQDSHSARCLDENQRISSGPGDRGVRSWGGQQLIGNLGQIFIGPGRNWDLLGSRYGWGRVTMGLVCQQLVFLPTPCLSSASLLPDNLSRLIWSALRWGYKDRVAAVPPGIAQLLQINEVDGWGLVLNITTEADRHRSYRYCKGASGSLASTMSW